MSIRTACACFVTVCCANLGLPITATLKSRENWFKKLVQIIAENLKLVSNLTLDDPNELPDGPEKDYCINFEHEQMTASKNLIIYQANFMKKINEVKRCNKETRLFLQKDEKDSGKKMKNKL